VTQPVTWEDLGNQRQDGLPFLAAGSGDVRSNSQVVGLKNLQGRAVDASFYTDNSINEPIYERTRGTNNLINVSSAFNNPMHKTARDRMIHVE